MADLQDIQIGALGGDSSDNKIDSVVRQLNEWGRNIANDDITRVQKDDAGNVRIIQGKTPYANVYGTLYYDTAGVPIALLGTAPDDGRFGFWIANEGENVITLLGG